MFSFIRRWTCRYIWLIICKERYFINLSYHILTPKIKETKCMVSLKSENSRNSYKEVTSPIPGYQGQLKSPRSAKNMRYWFALETPLRQFADIVISCLNNGLLRHWVDLQLSCLFRFSKTVFVSCLVSVMETLLRCFWGVFLRCLNNAFVRHCLDLPKSCLLYNSKTSTEYVLLSWQDSY